MAQFESHKQEIQAAGLGVVFIAAEKRGGWFRPEKYFAAHALSFPFLLDEDRKVTKAYGVYHRLGRDAFNIAHPATFVIDRKGVLRFIGVSENQAERVPIEEVRKAAAGL